jgi:hypothetical protein
VRAEGQRWQGRGVAPPKPSNEARARSPRPPLAEPHQREQPRHRLLARPRTPCSCCELDAQPFARSPCPREPNSRQPGMQRTGTCQQQWANGCGTGLLAAGAQHSRSPQPILSAEPTAAERTGANPWASDCQAGCHPCKPGAASGARVIRLSLECALQRVLFGWHGMPFSQTMESRDLHRTRALVVSRCTLRHVVPCCLPRASSRLFSLSTVYAHAYVRPICGQRLVSSFTSFHKCPVLYSLSALFWYSKLYRIDN